MINIIIAYFTFAPVVFTALMAVAIVLSALIAFFTIKENRKIEEEKIDIQRKSLEKNLLSEVRDNNFTLDKTKDDLGKLSEKVIKENLKNRVLKLVFIFTKKIAYQTFLNIDFKNERINPMLKVMIRL